MGLRYLSKYFSFKSFYLKVQQDDFLRCLGPPSPLNKQGLRAIFSSYKINPSVMSWLSLPLKSTFLSVRTGRIPSRRCPVLGVFLLSQCRFLSSNSCKKLSLLLLFIYSTVSEFVCCTDILFGLGITFTFLILMQDKVILSSRFLVAFYENTCPGLKKSFKFILINWEK